MRHLVELGHTRILHLAGPRRAPDAIERVRGWRDELAAHRLEIVEPRARRLVGGERLPARLASWTSSPGTAVFVANDHMSIGLLSALRERGLRVPEDVSVVGFDDVPEAGYLFPPLTTVRQDFAALGELIMQKVLIAVEEPDSADRGHPAADAPDRAAVDPGDQGLGPPAEARGLVDGVDSDHVVDRVVTTGQRRRPVRHHRGERSELMSWSTGRPRSRRPPRRPALRR